MFHLFFKCFLGIFASVLDACFKYFICLQTYIASVASECFKSTLGVASPRLLLSCLGISSSRRRLGIRRLLLLFSMLVTFGRPDASKPVDPKMWI
jgi:hypothetical protein